MTKKELRAEAKRRLCATPLTPPSVERILAIPEYKRAEIVFSYIATENEADPIEITKAALKEGKKVAVPKIRPDAPNSEMDFYFLSPTRPIEAQLKSGAFGIQEPTSEEKFKIPETLPAPNGKQQKEKIFIITPGLAFSKSGKRCGRGKGYYDRYFSRLKSAKIDFFAAGFYYPCQIFSDEEIETNENDFMMDFI